jgi:hypothetical protein
LQPSNATASLRLQHFSEQDQADSQAPTQGERRFKECHFKELAIKPDDIGIRIPLSVDN